MAWIKLTDNYEDDDKIIRLSDGAFRLWHQVISYCRRNPNDGLISRAAMLDRKAYRPKRLDELMTFDPKFEVRPLVSKVDGFGFVLNAYLDWNPSKEEDAIEKAAAKNRMRRVRGQCSPEHQPNRSPERSPSCSDPPAREVLERDGTDRKEGEKGSDAVGDRARWLMETYPEWYRLERHGARHRIIGGPLEFQDAMNLVETWNNQRLEQLARIVLTTDDEFISRTDRSFKIFALKASWADDRLTQWEKAQGKTA